jgi:uncharacterized protein YndB with AHSA1/START domain
MSERIVSADILVEAPAEVVFAILSDPRQHPRIDGSGSVQRVVAGPDRLTATGDTFGVAMRIGVPYVIRNVVVEHEPDRRIAWRHFGAHRWRYELTPEGTGTRVTETWDASRWHAVGFAVLSRLGFPERNRQGIEATLVRLKEAAEADARSANGTTG